MVIINSFQIYPDHTILLHVSHISRCLLPHNLAHTDGLNLFSGHILGEIAQKLTGDRMGLAYNELTHSTSTHNSTNLLPVGLWFFSTPVVFLAILSCCLTYTDGQIRFLVTRRNLVFRVTGSAGPISFKRDIMTTRRYILPGLFKWYRRWTSMSRIMSSWNQDKQTTNKSI